jgi:predicted acylesterase/phospholipase RssA
MFEPNYLDYSAFHECFGEKNLNFLDIIVNFIKEGYLKDRRILQKFTRDNTGDLTFQEAYDKTGWILNITVTGIGDHESYRVLNYLTAPNVLIWSAAVASCGIPYVYGPVEIYCKNEKNEIVQFLSGNLILLNFNRFFIYLLC